MEIKSIPDLKRVAFIGNHLPRQCGIATFTTDLSDAFTEQFPDIQSMVLAMNDTIDWYTYDDKVRYEIRESKLFDLISSLIGIALVPLIITYLLEVYTSLRARNTLGLEVHLHSAETGDAAEIIAALGRCGRFDTGYVVLAKWAADTTQVKESHHFHPILFYFRCQEPYYPVSRTSLISLDTITLIKSALDHNEYRWLKESAVVEQLKRSTILELKTLLSAFVSDANLDAPPDIDEQRRALWSRRYTVAVERLRDAGITTTKAGAEQYAALRAEWDRYITLLAPKFAYEMDEIDAALAKVT